MLLFLTVVHFSCHIRQENLLSFRTPLGFQCILISEVLSARLSNTVWIIVMNKHAHTRYIFQRNTLNEHESFIIIASCRIIKVFLSYVGLVCCSDEAR